MYETKGWTGLHSKLRNKIAVSLALKVSAWCQHTKTTVRLIVVSSQT